MNPPEDCDTLFISERRRPLSRVTIWLMINQVAQVAGLEHLEIHPHMLRHSCG
jgi:site-specific recombinase XerD